MRGYHAVGRRRRRRIARERQQLRAAKAMLPPNRRRRRRRARRARSPSRDAKLDPRAQKLLDMWPKTKAAYAGDEYVVKIRDKEIRTALDDDVAVRHQDPQGRAAAVRGRRRDPALAAAGERAGQLPVHRRRVRVQARERGPDADVRRRGRRVPHQPALPPARRRHAGEAAVHRVRLGHALRQRPRPPARHLRQGRQLRRVDRDARRHEGALLGLRPLRPDDVGVDDDQRPGADDPRDVRQHGDRPAGRQVPRRTTAASRPTTRPTRSARGRSRRCAAPCRPTS